MTKHRRKSWASWFPIERKPNVGLWRKPLGPNTWTTGFGEIPNGATAVPLAGIEANRKRWGEMI